MDERLRDAGRARIIAWWLLAMAAMLFGMVVLGGLTRLTDSGLSMVEWQPITGWLPPLSHEAWERTFEAYRQYPEYQKVNAGMTLAEFQGIFWLEYVHRLWGRLMGVAFALPFLVFLVRGWVDRPLAWKLAGIFVLGGLQGALGWWMVASGLVDRPDVSQYRLTLHLGAALLIYGYIVWVALDLLARARGEVPTPAAARGAVPGRAGAWAATALIAITILSGGFVAGLDAGYAYNTFPLMDGDLIPAQLFASTPAWRAPFEDVTTVQFIHRLLATTTLLAVLAFRLSIARADLPPPARLPVDLLSFWVLVQFGLGVATLLSIVALPLAALHQASAVILWTFALWSLFAIRRGAVPSPAVAGVRGRARRAADGAVA